RPNDAIEEVDLLFSERRGLRDGRHSGHPYWPWSGRDREQVIDDGEHDEQRDADAEAPGDQFLLDRQQRLGFGLGKFAGDIRFAHGNLLQLASGGLMPAKNSHEISRPTQMTKPNRLSA